jgi:hypothetical protein
MVSSTAPILNKIQNVNIIKNIVTPSQATDDDTFYSTVNDYKLKKNETKDRRGRKYTSHFKVLSSVKI